MCCTPRWTICRSLLTSPASMHDEPVAGARLEPGDFENVIRLTPLVAIYSVVMAVWIFGVGLRRYESSGH